MLKYLYPLKYLSDDAGEGSGYTDSGPAPGDTDTSSDMSGDTTGGYNASALTSAGFSPIDADRLTDISYVKAEDSISFYYELGSFPKPASPEIFRLNVKQYPEVKNSENPGVIPPEGGSRTISVKGTSGSIFSLTLLDKNADCTILKEPLTNISIPKNGEYSFVQKFPPTTTANRYYVNITPGLGTTIPHPIGSPTRKSLWKRIYGVNAEYVFHQYTNPTISFTKVTDGTVVNDDGTTGLASPRSTGYTLTGNDIKMVGRPGKKVLRYFSKKTDVINEDGTVGTDVNSGKAVSWTVTSTPFIYITSNPLGNHWINNNGYTKTVTSEVNNSDRITLDTTDGLKEGMYCIEIPPITKTIKKIEYYDTLDCDDNHTDRFKLNNIQGLSLDMIVGASGGDEESIYITGIDKDKQIITLSKKIYMPNSCVSDDSTFNFYYKENGGRQTNAIIKSVDCDNNITIHRPLRINAFTKLVFVGGEYENPPEINTDLTCTGSGTQSVTISGYVDVSHFGFEDTTFSLNVDEFLSQKPTAYNQNVTVSKDSSISIDFKAGDSEPVVKSVSIVDNPTRGTLSSTDPDTNTTTYTPHPSLVGKDEFTFKMTDSAGAISDIKTVYIKIIE